MENVVNLFPAEHPAAVLDRAAFLRAVTLANVVAETRSPIPALAYARFSSTSNGLVVTATDMDMEVNLAVVGDVDARFSVLLPVNAVYKFARKAAKGDRVSLRMLPTDNVDESQPEAHFQSDRCEVDFGQVSCALDSIAVADFPAPFAEPVEDAIEFEMASSIFWNAIDGTMTAASSDEARYYLNGVFLHAVEGKLCFAATDGHRLFVQTTNVRVPTGLAGILPSKAARFLQTMLNGYASARTLAISISEKRMSVSFDGVVMHTNLVDGTFPDYQRVIPASQGNVACFRASAFGNALVALTTLAPKAPVKLAFAGETCRISIENGDIGAAGSDLECSLDGDDIEIRFNAALLASMIELASPDGRLVTMRMSSPTEAVTVTGSISGWTGVLMPTQG